MFIRINNLWTRTAAVIVHEPLASRVLSVRAEHLLPDGREASENVLAGGTMRKILIGTLALMGAMALPTPAHAGVITGELDFSGGAQVSATAVNWWLTVVPSLSGPNLATINGSTIGDGGPCPGAGCVANLQPGGTAPNGLVHESNLPPLSNVGVPNLGINFFETEPSGVTPATPTLNFVLDFITPCTSLGSVTCPAALGPQSPFGLVQQPGFVAVTLVMTGRVWDTATPNLVSTWSGLWTANVPGTINDIVTTITGGGTISNSYSATKIVAIPTAVPEPATLLTFGLGSLALARYRRRKKA
jgi:hypothetical protein